MNRAGTEYFTIRTVTIADLSTLGFSTRPGSNSSVGTGARKGRSVSKSCPTVRILSLIRRASSWISQPRIRSLSSSRDSATGIGESRLRRNQPTSPSTPPFS
jgi:hypothetical protein